jgi:hypothetical protein
VTLVLALAAAWLLAVAVLTLDLTGVWRRGAYFRWQGLGVLIGIGAGLTSAFAQFRGWPASQLHGLRMITDPLTLAGAALLLVASLLQSGTRHTNGGPRPSNQVSNDDQRQRRTTPDTEP